jgi:hypothetical protein
MEKFIQLLKTLWAYIEVTIRRAQREADEDPSAYDTVSEERTMPTVFDFDGVKDVALEALEDANAKEELLGVLNEHKGVFVDEAKGYLQAVVSTFKGDKYDPAKYAEFIDALSDEQLVAEAGATADEIDGLVASYNAKKKFIEDLKTTVSFVARKAIVAGLTAYVGPAAGPIASLIGL